VKNPKAAYMETIYDPVSSVADAISAWGVRTYVDLKEGGLCRNSAVYRSYEETI